MQVFCASPWVPAEWIKAHGLEARGVWLAEDSAYDSFSVSAGVCAFAQSIVRLANRHTDAAFVLTSHCDQMRRAFDVLAGARAERIFLLNFPATWQTETAVRLFSSELERLSRFLVKLGGHVPNTSELGEILRQNQQRQAVLSAAPHLSARQLAAVPLAIIGGPLLASHWNLLEEIERLGGRIVLNATESGEPSLLPSLAPDEFDHLAPYPLASAFLKGCAGIFQRPNTPFYAWLGKRLGSCKPRGIILWHYVACDLWRAEAAHLRDTFGLPVLQLEADNAESCSVRNLGRVQAFLESLSGSNTPGQKR